jgi:hypothetical protein
MGSAHGGHGKGVSGHDRPSALRSKSMMSPGRAFVVGYGIHGMHGLNDELRVTGIRRRSGPKDPCLGVETEQHEWPKEDFAEYKLRIGEYSQVFPRSLPSPKPEMRAMSSAGSWLAQIFTRIYLSTSLQGRRPESSGHARNQKNTF